MRVSEFESVLNRRLELTRKVLASKREEYAADGDRMSNFRRAALMLGCTRQRALVGMMAKHWVSILDMVDQWEEKKTIFSAERIEEKVGDAINYLVLLEAIMKDDADLLDEEDAADHGETVPIAVSPMTGCVDCPQGKDAFSALLCDQETCPKKEKPHAQ